MGVATQTEFAQVYLSLCLLADNNAARSATMISEYISNEQAEGQSCHASSVAVLGDGRALATWFSGTHEKNPDVVIKLAVRPEESGWGEPFTVAAVRNAEGDSVAHWNPVLFVHDGVVTLYFKIGATIDIWRQYQMTAPESTADFSDLSAWTSPVEMVEGPEGEAGRGAVRTEQITLDGGATWLAGGSTEATNLDEVRRIRAAAKAAGGMPHASTLEVGWRSFVDRSFDGGKSWERSPYLTVTDTHVLKGKLPSTDGAEGEMEVQVGLIQPSIWASSATDVHVLCRSNGGKKYHHPKLRPMLHVVERADFVALVALMQVGSTDRTARTAEERGARLYALACRITTAESMSAG